MVNENNKHKLRPRTNNVSYSETVKRTLNLKKTDKDSGKTTKSSDSPAKAKKSDNKEISGVTVPDSHTTSTSATSRASLSKRASIPLNTSVSKNRLSSTTTSRPVSVALNQSLIDKINSIDTRIKVFEEGSAQESRIAAIESAFEQLKSENSNLQQTISLLRSDLQTVQLLLAQLCDLASKFEDSNNCNRRLVAENEQLKTTVEELKTESSELKSAVMSLTSKAELINRTSALTESRITIEQEEVNSNLIVRLKLKLKLNWHQPIQVFEIFWVLVTSLISTQ